MLSIDLCTNMAMWHKYMYVFAIYISHKYSSLIFRDINLILGTTTLHIKLSLCLSEFRYYNLFLSSIFFSLGHKILCTKARPMDDMHNFGSLKDQELALLINISLNHYLLINLSFKFSPI